MSAPGSLPGHALVFKGGKPGIYKVYLDNLRLRHADGSATPIWSNRKDTRPDKFRANELFQNLKVGTRDASTVNK